jgi:hypothetical protein
MSHFSEGISQDLLNKIERELRILNSKHLQVLFLWMNYVQLEEKPKKITRMMLLLSPKMTWIESKRQQLLKQKNKFQWKKAY